MAAQEQHELRFFLTTLSLILLSVVLCLAGLWWLLKSPERAVQARDYVPDGLFIRVVDFPSDPNLVSYDSTRVSEADLSDFAYAYCNSGRFEIAEKRPSRWDSFFSLNRASVVCW